MTIRADELIKSVRSRIRQRKEKASNFTDEAILDYANDAVREICRDTVTFRTFRKYVGDGGSKYPLPSNAFELFHVTAHGRILPWLTVEDTAPGDELEIGELVATNQWGVIVLGGFLYFLPALNSNERRFLHYKGFPPPINDTKEGTWDLSEGVQTAFIYRVTADLLLEVGQDTKATIWEARYQAERRQMKKSEFRKQHPGPMRQRRPKVFVA